MVKIHKCPICGQETNNEKYRPFCSKRCADVDLGKWFNGDYVISSMPSCNEDLGGSIQKDDIREDFKE